jgi:hypothetical protein
MSDKNPTDEANFQPFYDSDEARRFIASQTGERLESVSRFFEAVANSKANNTGEDLSDYVCRATSLGLIRVARMFEADIAYRASVGLITPEEEDIMQEWVDNMDEGDLTDDDWCYACGGLRAKTFSADGVFLLCATCGEALDVNRALSPEQELGRVARHEELLRNLNDGSSSIPPALAHEYFLTWSDKKTQLVLTAHDRGEVTSGVIELVRRLRIEFKSNGGELVVIFLQHASFDGKYKKYAGEDFHRVESLTIRDFEISDSCFYELAREGGWEDVIDDQPADESDS